MRQIILQYSIFLIMVFAILCVVAYAIFGRKGYSIQKKNIVQWICPRNNYEFA